MSKEEKIEQAQANGWVDAVVLQRVWDSNQETGTEIKG